MNNTFFLALLSMMSATCLCEIHGNKETVSEVLEGNKLPTDLVVELLGRVPHIVAALKQGIVPQKVQLQEGTASELMHSLCEFIKHGAPLEHSRTIDVTFSLNEEANAANTVHIASLIESIEVSGGQDNGETKKYRELSSPQIDEWTTCGHAMQIKRVTVNPHWDLQGDVRASTCTTSIPKALLVQKLIDRANASK